MLQAKSGTGKTVTFGIIILDALSAALAAPQALVVEPTREVALQVQRTIAVLCKELPLQARVSRIQGVNAVTEAHVSQCAAFVGGLPVHADTARLRGSSCQVVVGTPGRLRALIQDGSMQTEHLRLLVRSKLALRGGIGRDTLLQVLDEADTLLAGGFVDDIAFVYGALPTRKQVRRVALQLRRGVRGAESVTSQVLAFSATYTEVLLAQLRQLMNAPQEVMLCPETVTLRGAYSGPLVVKLCVNRRPLYAGVKQVYHEVSCGAIVTCASFDACARHCNCRTHGLRYTGGTGTSVLNVKEAALVRILGSLWFNQVRTSCKDARARSTERRLFLAAGARVLQL